MFENEIGDIRARNPTEQIGKQTHARSVNAGTSAIGLPRRTDIWMLTSPVHPRNARELPSSTRQSH
jgi:hypothetical protein